MATQKELLKEHRAGLDAKFHKKYPNGQFVVQKQVQTHNFNGNLGLVTFGLYWNPRRSTSATRPSGIAVRSRDYYSKEDGIYYMKYQPSSGGCKYYTSLDQLVESAKKLGFSAEFIAAFVEKYNQDHFKYLPNNHVN